MTAPSIIELSGIGKSFPGVRSLDDIDFSTEAGEIHGLVGENGAGKSTLIKIIAGAYQPDEGTIRFDGEVRQWRNPGEARAAGIHVIYQELALCPRLSVAENVFLGNQPQLAFGFVDRKKMRRQTCEIFERLGHQLEPRRRVSELSVADQQMVEIAKALVGEAKLLILDEPTAVISGRDAGVLFERLRSLQKTGVSLIYVSHRLEELFALVDRVTVLKDGKTVGCWPIRELDRPSLITKMVGRTLDKIFPAKKPPVRRDIVLAVRGVSAATAVKDVSFDLCRGEVLGIAGLVGAGRSELAHTLFGSLPLRAGTIEVAEADLRRPSPCRAIASGIGFLTEDRKSEGLFMNLPVAANISAPNLRKLCSTFLIRQAEEQRLAAEEIKKYSIAAPSAKSGVKFLSGGNQQKILISRWVQIATNVLILDEPTRGVDVGAKVEIYRIIRILAERGIGILVISSELPEIIGLCDRVLVMRAGRITGELNGNEIAEEPIMHLATQ